jgi:CRISPR-associated protein Cmr5
MSQQLSLEQKRAEAAWDAIEQVKQRNDRLDEKKKYAKEYSSLARSAPADIQANGLGQTLAFWRAKGYERGQPKPDNAQAELFGHVANWLRKQKILPDGNDPVQWICKDATTDQYRRASAEAIAFLIWLKRFAEAELPKEGD